MEQNSQSKLEAMKARIAAGRKAAYEAWLNMEASQSGMCLKTLRQMAA